MNTIEKIVTVIIIFTAIVFAIVAIPILLLLGKIAGVILVAIGVIALILLVPVIIGIIIGSAGK